MSVKLTLDRSLAVEESFEKQFGSIESLAQLSSGSYESTACEITGTDFSISNYSNSQKIAVKYRTAPNQTMFLLCYMPLSFPCWSGIETTPYVLAVHHPQRDYYAILPAGWRAIEFSVANELLEKHELLASCEAMNTSQVESIVPLGRTVSQAVASRAQGFFGAVRALDSADTVPLDIFLRDYVMSLLTTLLESTQLKKNVPEIHLQSKYWMVQRAIEFIEGNLSEAVGVVEISDALNQSPRALQYAFREVMQVSPCQYQQMRRLLMVRKQAQSNPDMSLNRVARRYGFAHYGRFTQQYRRTFGETLSETSRVDSSHVNVPRMNSNAMNKTKSIT